MGNASINLGPMDFDMTRCSDAEPHLIALNAEDFYRYVIANGERLTYFPREYQHFPTLLSLKRVRLHGRFFPFNALTENQ